MKKVIIVLMALMLISATVVSAATQSQGANSNKDVNSSLNSSKKDFPTQNAYEVVSQLQEQKPNHGLNTSIQALEQIQSKIQEKQEEVNSTMPNSTKNQKMAAVAVQTMETTASMFGKSEANVSRISNDIKNSFEISTKAEERIRGRSGFVKFFAGGDNEAAGLIVQEIARNENRIRELNRLIDDSDFDSQTKAVLQDQVQNIEQEQLRLKALAEEELNNKGLFGWIWK